MSHNRELDQDRDFDESRRSTETGTAPGRGTRAQDMIGPLGPMPSGILMRKARDANGVEAGAEDAIARAGTSSGHALPDVAREKFEGSLGADLSSVRVHTGADSAASAGAVGARAYTLGNDIHFGAGQYDPTSAAGEHLLAHEVAHTVQQSGGIGRKAQFKLEVSAPGDAYEVEADRAADAMVAGAAATVTGASGLARKVMREVSPSVSVGTGGSKAAYSDTISLGKVPLGKGAVGPVDLEGELAGKVAWEATLTDPGENRVTGPGLDSPAPEKKEEGGGPEVKGKLSKDKISVEVENQTKGIPGGLTAKYGGGLEITKDGVGLEGSGSIEGEWKGASFTLVGLKLKLLDLKDGKFEPIKGELTSSVTFSPYTIHTASGVQVKLTPGGEVTVKVTPDGKKIAEWVAEKFAEDAAMDAAASAAAAGGAIAAAVLIGIGAAIDVSEGNDIGKICGDAYTAIGDYATCYAGAIHNTAAGAAGKYGSQGFAQGQLDRQKLLRKYPDGVVDAQADGAAAKVVSTARERFKAEATAKFKANHAIMTKVRDGELPSDFAQVLDASTNNAAIGDKGTVAQDKVGRTKAQEMEILQGATQMALAKVRDHLGGMVVPIAPDSKVVGCAGHALQIRRIGYFDDWRPNPAEFVEAQPDGALQINGADQYMAGIDVHADNSPDEKQKAMSLVAEQLLARGKIMVAYRRLPMKDDTPMGDQGARNVETAHDVVTQNEINAMGKGDE